MFSFGGFSAGSYAKDDLLEYRQHYPTKRDEPNAWECVEIFRNEMPMRSEGIYLDDFLKDAKAGGKRGSYRYLESSHSFIQSISPIREKGLDWNAQPLMRHEIVTMRSDAAILQRVVRMFDLMLDFYGFKIESLGDPELLKPRLVRLPKSLIAKINAASAAQKNAKKASASATKKKDSDEDDEEDDGADDGSAADKKSKEARKMKEKKSDDDDDDEDNSTEADYSSEGDVVFVGDGSHRVMLPPTSKLLSQCIAPAPLPANGPSGGARIVRKAASGDSDFDWCVDNLNTSSHNYLRITRMLKFLGEMGLEHLKVAWLECFERELYGQAGDILLYNVASSFQDYFLGTIYDDTLRAAMQERAKEGLVKAKAAKDAAWKTKYGGGYSSSVGGGFGGFGGFGGSYGYGKNAVVIDSSYSSGDGDGSRDASDDGTKNEDGGADNGQGASASASATGASASAAGGAASGSQTLEDGGSSPK